MKYGAMLVAVALVGNVAGCDELFDDTDDRKAKVKAESKNPGGSGCSNLSGVYDLTEVIDKSKCEDGDKTETLNFSVNFVQNGCKGTMTVPGTNISLKGSVTGSKLSVSGTYEDGGSIFKAVDLTLSGSTVSGSANWTYDMSGLYKCKGTSKFSGAKK